jgi:hypothetical protein
MGRIGGWRKLGDGDGQNCGKMEMVGADCGKNQMVGADWGRMVSTYPYQGISEVELG